MASSDDRSAGARRPTRVDTLLALENRFFGLVLGFLGVLLWIDFFGVVGFVRHFEPAELLSPAFTSMGVTLLSAVYLTAVSAILLLPSRPYERYRSALPNAVAVFGGLGVYLLAVLPRGRPSDAVVAAAVAMLGVGILIVLASLVYLGRAFSVTPHASTLVTRGPYRFVRHPMYVGNLLSLTGMALLFDSLWAYLLCGLLCVLQVARAVYEEALLERTMPEYSSYKARVGGFLPRGCLPAAGAIALCVLAVGPLTGCPGPADPEPPAESVELHTPPPLPSPTATPVPIGVAPPAAATAEPQPPAAADTPTPPPPDPPASTPTDPVEARCFQWMKSARLGRWFDDSDLEAFNELDGADEVGPVCLKFLALQGECQAQWFLTMLPEAGYAEAHGGEEASEDDMAAWARGEFMRRMDARPECMSILGTDSCEDVKAFARAPGAALTSAQKTVLQRCLDPRARGAGLLRAAL